MAKLDRYWDGKWASTLVLEKRTYVVGRDHGCDMILKDPLASRRHFELQWHEGEGIFVLVDLETRNGTIVNGVKEQSYRLVKDTTLQVGQEFLFYYPHLTDALPSSPDIETALKGGGGIEARTDEFSAMKTAFIHPADLARMAADVRARQRPHLLRRRREEITVFALKEGGTEIGFGPVDASLGPSRGGRPKVLAELVEEDGSYQIRARGWFKKILVDDVLTRSKALNGGERLNVGGVILEFYTGLLKDNNGNGW